MLVLGTSIHEFWNATTRELVDATAEPWHDVCSTGDQWDEPGHDATERDQDSYAFAVSPIGREGEESDGFTELS
jgi:hypothetical protein